MPHKNSRQLGHNGHIRNATHSFCSIHKDLIDNAKLSTNTWSINSHISLLLFLLVHDLYVIPDQVFLKIFSTSDQSLRCHKNKSVPFFLF